MNHAVRAIVLAVATTITTTGCVTTAGFVKRPAEVSLPLLIGAAVADLVVTSAAASQIQEYSWGGSIATGLALTAVDAAVGCLTGACAALRL